MNSDTQNVVCVLTCPNCPDYIGETSKPTRIRMNNQIRCKPWKTNRSFSAHAISHKKYFRECLKVKAVKKFEIKK